MDFKKVIPLAVLAGMMVFAAAGCGIDTGTTSVAQQPVPSGTLSAPGTRTPPPSDSAMPSPPSDNGTIPAPPQGGIQGEQPAMPEIDYAAVAAKLGVTEEQLTATLGELGQGPLDMAAIAEKLGVSEDALREVLGFAAGGPPQGGPPPDNAALPTSESQTY